MHTTSDTLSAGWNSWDYYRWTITEEEVLKNAEFIAKDPVLSRHVKRIIVDDGWQYCYGEWEANSYFPSGMEYLAKELTKMGFEPGLWFAPAIAEPHSRIAQLDYDMLARSAGGQPCLAYECMRRFGFVLDPTVKKTEEFINREFTDIKQGEDYICGYFPIGQNKATKKIYAEIITTDFIKDYVDIFTEIGVKLKAVYSGESSLIRLTASTAAQQYKTFVLQIADRMTITTILWVNGEFYYFNSARCFHDQGTEDYAQDIARSVSQIRQFMQANQLDYPIEAVLLAGVNPQDLPLYQNAISQLDIYARVEVFADTHVATNGLDVQAHFHPISGLVTGNAGKQNFLDGYHAGKKKETEGGGVGKGFLAILISLAVMLVGLAVCITVRTLKKQELQKLKEYNESPATIMEVARYDVLLEQTSYLSNQYNAIVGVNQNLYTYPVCNCEVMSVVDDCAQGLVTVTFDSFDADLGVLTMTARADTVDNINKFIRNLCGVDIFSNVDYTGYSYVESDELWDIHVTCTLAESAGRHTDTDAQPETTETNLPDVGDAE